MSQPFLDIPLLFEKKLQSNLIYYTEPSLRRGSKEKSTKKKKYD